MEKYRRYLFIAVIIIVLGILFTTVLKAVATLGIILIVVGGILFVISMFRKGNE